MEKRKTDMTVSVPRTDENGEQVIKVYRIWKDVYGALFVKMNDTFMPISDLVEALKEVTFNA